MRPPIQHTLQKSASIVKLFDISHKWINKSVLVEVKQNTLDHWQNSGEKWQESKQVIRFDISGS